MSRLTKAIKLAAEVHEHQVDKGGEEYILHPLEVMRKVELGGRFINNPHDRECLLVSAILHDAIEDFEEHEPGERDRLDRFIYTTFGDRNHSVIRRLSKLSDETYDEYIERVAEDWIARRVKIADLTHNMDTGRLPEGEIQEKDFLRWDKYRRALVRLKRED